MRPFLLRFGTLLLWASAFPVGTSGQEVDDTLSILTAALLMYAPEGGWRDDAGRLMSFCPISDREFRVALDTMQIIRDWEPGPDRERELEHERSRLPPFPDLSAHHKEALYLVVRDSLGMRIERKGCEGGRDQSGEEAITLGLKLPVFRGEDTAIVYTSITYLNGPFAGSRCYWIRSEGGQSWERGECVDRWIS